MNKTLLEDFILSTNAMIQSSTNQLCNNKLILNILCFGIQHLNSQPCNNDPILIQIVIAIIL